MEQDKLIPLILVEMQSMQRPGRSSPRIKRTTKFSVKHITYTNYKREIES